MKRLAFILIPILLFTLYIDLTKGTIPSPAQPLVTSEINGDALYVTVSRGDTLLSIMEKNGLSSSSIDIDALTHEFKRLNNGIEPKEMKAGSRYYIPRTP
ncbi:LysM peptidoglycan-binding domain-containing protein [Jeotgalibacillus soli]|nr:LysM peptidoglycan-binding domain-containing protein [Jeotgalibacillus soli]